MADDNKELKNKEEKVIKAKLACLIQDIVNDGVNRSKVDKLIDFVSRLSEKETVPEDDELEGTVEEAV